MVRWNKQKIVDAACIPDITVPEIAKLLGSSLRLVEKQLRYYRADVEAARQSIQLSDRVVYKILDFWGDGLSNSEIAAAMNLSGDIVRRVILIAEYDEQGDAAQPSRLSQDDVRAIGECGGRVMPRFATTDFVLPFSEDVARYKVPPAPARRPITLATSPMSF